MLSIPLSSSCYLDGGEGNDGRCSRCGTRSISAGVPPKTKPKPKTSEDRRLSAEEQDQVQEQEQEYDDEDILNDHDRIPVAVVYDVAVSYFVPRTITRKTIDTQTDKVGTRWVVSGVQHRSRKGMHPPTIHRMKLGAAIVAVLEANRIEAIGLLFFEWRVQEARSTKIQRIESIYPYIHASIHPSIHRTTQLFPGGIAGH